MSILGEVMKDLIGMFVADARLSAAILVLVAGVAALLRWQAIGHGAAGGLLLAGALALVVASVARAARR